MSLTPRFFEVARSMEMASASGWDFVARLNPCRDDTDSASGRLWHDDTSGMEPEAAATPEPCKHGFRAAACLW